VGLNFIHEGTHDAAIRGMAFGYVTDDVMPCLSPSPIDLAAYRDVVLERFGNPAIRDTNQRVAADGFSKIPGFIAPTVRERLAAGATIDSVAMLPALFLAFLQRWHQGALPYAYQDQGMDEAVAHAICDAADPVLALCSDAGLWGLTAGDARLVDAVRRASERVARFIETERKP
jgi:D-arabinitol 4-dehydrogenase